MNKTYVWMYVYIQFCADDTCPLYPHVRTHTRVNLCRPRWSAPAHAPRNSPLLPPPPSSLPDQVLPLGQSPLRFDCTLSIASPCRHEEHAADGFLTSLPLYLWSCRCFLMINSCSGEWLIRKWMCSFVGIIYFFIHQGKILITVKVLADIVKQHCR